MRHIEVTFAPEGSPEFTINPIASALLYPQTFIKFQVEKQVSSEPNGAYLELYNLNDEHSGAIDFVYDPYAIRFGPRVTIKGGYTDGTINQMYSGVVVQALTTFEPPNYVTRVECRNIYYELMSRSVDYQVAAGATKADAILSIIKQVGGVIESGQELSIRNLLSGAKYDESERIQGTLDQIVTQFSKGLPRRIIVYWDDAGVSFDPLGKPSSGRATKEISEASGLIGSPKVTTSGIEYETLLDASYRVNDPVVISSYTTDRLKAASGGPLLQTVSQTGIPTKIERQEKYVVSKIIHSGDNREGDFKTSVTTKFIDLIQQAFG